MLFVLVGSCQVAWRSCVSLQKQRICRKPPTMLRMCKNSFLSIEAGLKGPSSHSGGAEHEHVHSIVVM